MLLNGSGKLSYFRERQIEADTVKSVYIGYDPGRGAFTYPSIAKGGALLGIHYKTEVRDAKGKRRQWWGGYSNDLPSKGHGKKPDDPAKVVPFGLETLNDHEPGSLAVLCCGEEDALSLRQLGYTSVSQPGAGLLEPAYTEGFSGLKVVVFYDAGEEQEARKDGLKVLQAGAASVRIAAWPCEALHGADINGRLIEDPEGFEAWAAKMITEAKPLALLDTEKNEDREGEPDRYASTRRKESWEAKPTQSELLIDYADDAELFHAPDGEGYATVEVDGHKETWPLKSRRFTQWLLRRYYAEHGKAPGAQALTDARATIAARAAFACNPKVNCGFCQALATLGLDCFLDRRVVFSD
jgi:hypothetical protein